MRATLDLDDPAEIDVISAWNRLKNHGDGRVFGRISASGEGIHLKVHKCDPEQVREIRRRLGDDQKRRDMDAESELKPAQILFSSKPGDKSAGEWTTNLDKLITQYRRQCPPEIRYPDHPAAQKTVKR